MKNINNKIKEYLISNPWIRGIKIFINQTLKPFGIKLIVFIFSLLLITIIFLQFFNPKIVKQSLVKGKLYFLHYLNLDNFQFSEVKIFGNKRVKSQEIIAILENSKDKIFNDSVEYQPLIQNLIDEIKTKLPWINKITISRNMPNKLIISLIEYEPFAIWHSDDKKFIIDRDGNSIPYENIENENEFNDMIILSGKSANNHAKALFNIFSINPELSDKIYSATWVGDRRWNIRFDNGLLVKLPEDEIYNAWQQLINIYRKGNIDEFKVIDLRIVDKIYIEFNDNQIKELKS